MTDDLALQPLVAAALTSLADLLEEATDAQWDTPSLCDGWRVREVVAHMTMAARYPEDAFMAELERCGFDFTRLSNEVAARDAELSTQDLIANLRSDVMQQWTPPGGGYRGALNHAVIHGLDITVPLGVARCASDATMRQVLDDLTEGGVHANFGIDISGRRLEATDVDWSHGSGLAVRGTAADLALAMCGRSVSTVQLAATP
jgi:uncharacterized protein (TIGR03083 family)